MLLFALPLYAIALVYGAAALLPAIYLMRYIYRKDTVEKEPPMLLMSLLIYGVIAALISIILENIGTKVLDSLMDQSTVGYTLVLAFAVVAVVEEGAKFAMLKRRTWNDMNFNYRFDGIVYAVFVSLGFAAFENIGNVLGYGLSVAPARALLAIPGDSRPHVLWRVHGNLLRQGKAVPGVGRQGGGEGKPLAGLHCGGAAPRLLRFLRHDKHRGVILDIHSLRHHNVYSGDKEGK